MLAMNDENIYFTGKIKELAHCKLCCEPMFIIYSAKLRDYCYECEHEMGIETDRRLWAGL
jgi:hypothetical protein